MIATRFRGRAARGIVPRPAGPAPVSRGEKRTAAVDRQRGDGTRGFLRVSKARQLLTPFQVPEPSGLVPTAGAYSGAAGAKSYTGYLSGMSAQDPELPPLVIRGRLRQVPDADGAVPPAGGRQGRAIRADRQVQHCVGVPTEGGPDRPVLAVPDVNDPVSARRGQGCRARIGQAGDAAAMASQARDGTPRVEPAPEVDAPIGAAQRQAEPVGMPGDPGQDPCLPPQRCDV